MASKKNAVIIRHTTVVLKLQKKVDKLLTQAKAIYKAVTNIANFPTFPTTSITPLTLNGDISALDTNESNLKTKPPTSTTTQRDAAKKKVTDDLEYVRLGVQALVNAAPANADAIANNAGMTVKGTKQKGARSDAAKNGKVEGSILLTGAGKGAHQWQMSSDGITWKDLPPTTTGKTEVDGLTSGTWTYFRNRTVLPKGQYGAWCNPIKIMVN